MRERNKGRKRDNQGGQGSFLEAMQEAGYQIDLKTLKAIYAAAKVKRKPKPKPRSDNRTLDLFDKE